MVALYSPPITTSNTLGFNFDDDPISFLFEDFNPEKQHLASSSPSNLDPYYSSWDVDQLISPSIFTDPPKTPPPCVEPARHPSPPAVSSGYSGKSAGQAGEATVVGERKKKQSHNASERMRRTRINSLYASLRALLPATHQMKKLSIPNTVDRVVKYIPELQKEVQMLIERKEELWPAPGTSVNFLQSAADKSSSATCSCSVEATELGNGEVSVQISAPESLLTTLVPISEVLRELEEDDGFLVVGVSSSDHESGAGRVFHHFHLMALEASHNMIKCEELREKLLRRCQKWEELCLWMISQGLSSTAA